MNQVVLVSSNANNGTNAGTFIVNANNDSSNRNRNIGTRLAVSSAFKTNSFPCGKICQSNTGNSLMAYKGWVKFCNAKALWRKHTTQVISMFPKQIRRAV